MSGYHDLDVQLAKERLGAMDDINRSNLLAGRFTRQLIQEIIARKPDIWPMGLWIAEEVNSYLLAARLLPEPL